MSHQSSLTLQVGTVVAQLARGCREAWVHDRGSGLVWTGGLTTLIARAFPDCTVVGVDRVEKVIEFAKAAAARVPNVRFVPWNYSDMHGAPPLRAQALVSSLGIELSHSHSAHVSTLVHDLRACPAYTCDLGQLTPYLRCWRAVALKVPLCTLFFVSPIPSRSWKCSNAAQRSGWTELLEHFDEDL